MPISRVRIRRLLLPIDLILVIAIATRGARDVRQGALRQVHGAAVAIGGRARGGSRLGNLALLAAHLVEQLKVPLGYGGLVFATEDADLEVRDLGIRGSRFEAGCLEVVQVLVDDVVGVDVPRNVLA